MCSMCPHVLTTCLMLHIFMYSALMDEQGNSTSKEQTYIPNFLGRQITVRLLQTLILCNHMN